MITKAALVSALTDFLGLILPGNEPLCEAWGQNRRACLGVRTIAAVATIFAPPGTLAAQDALLLIIPSLAMANSMFRKLASIRKPMRLRGNFPVLIRLGRFAERLVPVAQGGCDRRSQVASTENWSAPSVVVDFRGELPSGRSDLQAAHCAPVAPVTVGDDRAWQSGRSSANKLKVIGSNPIQI
ncbi:MULTISPECIES: hypothetical protein [unclassified Bradyrhizobium]|uniref:hypothetical protein n=3 Tax=unclassified Bradyrhizobium TaxID=2631580 RepID=UPI001BAC5855|nr:MULTISPECIES: hypothetical protein [unclassified Bradyrhizobium]MBR1344160.1 hypothetical protein [Bradyrhizobium sp. AUGA SZCCT0105]MBR1357853.1 hypothetical protein [Bradyrhizobium sp. AUGA SZCCT0045]